MVLQRLEPAPLAPLALPVLLLLLLPLGVLRPPQNVHALHRQKEQSKALSKPEHHPSHNSVVVSPGLTCACIARRCNAND